MINFGFQKLDVYQLAKDLAIENYKATSTFPESEKYSLIQQMNRAAVSVPSNIAEGYAREGKKDKCHFLNISYSSLMELVCQYEILKEMNYIDDDYYEELIGKANVLAIKISNFRTYLKNK